MGAALQGIRGGAAVNGGASGTPPPTDAWQEGAEHGGGGVLGIFCRRVKIFIIAQIFCKNFSHSKKVREPNGFMKFPLAIRINRV